MSILEPHYIGSQHAKVRQKTIPYVYSNWDGFWAYVPQYTRDKYKMIMGQDEACGDHVEVVITWELYVTNKETFCCIFIGHYAGSKIMFSENCLELVIIICKGKVIPVL
jgi:hypothetical protein